VNFDDVTFDPVLVSLAVFFLVCAIYLLFLRNSVMWGFICLVGVAVMGILMLYPDMNWAAR
jgi:hypothetical protein